MLGESLCRPHELADAPKEKETRLTSYDGTGAAAHLYRPAWSRTMHRAWLDVGQLDCSQLVRMEVQFSGKLLASPPCKSGAAFIPTPRFASVLCSFLVDRHPSCSEPQFLQGPRSPASERETDVENQNSYARLTSIRSHHIHATRAHAAGDPGLLTPTPCWSRDPGPSSKEWYHPRTNLIPHVAASITAAFLQNMRRPSPSLVS